MHTSSKQADCHWHYIQHALDRLERQVETLQRQWLWLMMTIAGGSMSVTGILLYPYFQPH